MKKNQTLYSFVSISIYCLFNLSFADNLKGGDDSIFINDIKADNNIIINVKSPLHKETDKFNFIKESVFKYPSEWYRHFHKTGNWITTLPISGPYLKYNFSFSYKTIKVKPPASLFTIPLETEEKIKFYKSFANYDSGIGLLLKDLEVSESLLKQAIHLLSQNSITTTMNSSAFDIIEINKKINTLKIVSFGIEVDTLDIEPVIESQNNFYRFKKHSKFEIQYSTDIGFLKRKKLVLYEQIPKSEIRKSKKKFQPLDYVHKTGLLLFANKPQSPSNIRKGIALSCQANNNMNSDEFLSLCSRLIQNNSISFANKKECTIEKGFYK